MWHNITETSGTITPKYQFVNVHGQDADKTVKNTKPKAWFGLRAGTDLSTPTIDTDVIHAQLKSNYQFGVYARLGRKVFLQPEVYYSVCNEQNTIGAGVADKVVVNSVKAPVLLGAEIIDLGLASVHIMAGPMATIFLEQNPASYPVERKKYDYRLQLGGGIDILKFITLDVRYSVNLNKDIEKELGHLSFKSGVNVSLGIQFR